MRAICSNVLQAPAFWRSAAASNGEARRHLLAKRGDGRLSHMTSDNDSPSVIPSGEKPHRERCYTCFRPIDACYCATLPRIDNRTELLIVQHRRESFHPFNTARLVARSLQRATLVTDHLSGLAARLKFRANAGLLYPGGDARLLDDVPPHERPAQLVVVDGTWQQAKSLLRGLPAMAALPRFRLAPESPSLYRIRREPTAESLSTVEAVVAALRMLEPETAGFDRLLAVFHAMIDRQIAHPKASAEERRRVLRRRRTLRNIPLALTDGLQQIVVAYGESTPHPRGANQNRPAPLVWVAERMVSHERFVSLIRPTVPLDDQLLAHFELERADFETAPTLEEARRAWQAFLRPDDRIAMYGPSTARLAATLDIDPRDCVLLKAIDFNPDQRYATLDDVLTGERLTVEPPIHASRAGQRLANAKALVQHLHALASDFQERLSDLGREWGRHC